MSPKYNNVSLLTTCGQRISRGQTGRQFVLKPLKVAHVNPSCLKSPPYKSISQVLLLLLLFCCMHQNSPRVTDT